MTRSASEIAAWITERLSELLSLPASEIDPNQPLLRLGLDSVGVVTLASDLEKWAGYRFKQNPLEEYPTINALAEFVAMETSKSGLG